jgi:hypothetical protein
MGKFWCRLSLLSCPLARLPSKVHSLHLPSNPVTPALHIDTIKDALFSTKLHILCNPFYCQFFYSCFSINITLWSVMCKQLRHKHNFDSSYPYIYIFGLPVFKNPKKYKEFAFLWMCVSQCKMNTVESEGYPLLSIEFLAYKVVLMSILGKRDESAWEQNFCSRIFVEFDILVAGRAEGSRWWSRDGSENGRGCSSIANGVTVEMNLPGLINLRLSRDGHALSFSFMRKYIIAILAEFGTVSVCLPLFSRRKAMCCQIARIYLVKYLFISAREIID